MPGEIPDLWRWDPRVGDGLKRVEGRGALLSHCVCKGVPRNCSLDRKHPTTGVCGSTSSHPFQLMCQFVANGTE